MRAIAVILVSLALLAADNAQSGHPQSAVNVVGRKEVIPTGYKTYSFFLICNPEWLDPAKNAGLTDLYYNFVAFGRSIGDDQAAVWFWKTTVPRNWENTMPPRAAIDVERSVQFCKAWNLKPSEGPYLVVTTNRPDEAHLTAGLPDGTAVFAMGGLSSSQISTLLSKLTDSLLLSGNASGVVAPGANSGPPASPPANAAIWIRMLSATQQLIGEFGCAVSLKVNAGPLQANLKSCKSPA